MLAALKHYPGPVRLLLLATFILTLARALTLPYLVVYLADNFQLSVGHIGLLIGGALIVASLLSLTCGSRLAGDEAGTDCDDSPLLPSSALTNRRPRARLTDRDRVTFFAPESSCRCPAG